MDEPVAEHERDRLDDYFVETSAFYGILDAIATIVVGRRGTGKTATSIALQAELSRSRRTHTCVINPEGYEVEGLVRLVSEEWHAAERGFLIESLWKFVIYSELAGSVYRELKDRPLYQQPTNDEERLMTYVERHMDILLAPFSQRLNRAVSALSGTGQIPSTEDQRARISEHLHNGHLGALRGLLGQVLYDREKVAILIDNLDEPWRPGRNTVVLTELLLGLLREIQDLAIDFQHADFRQRKINASLTAFIRSDIFAYIRPLAPEQDKWPIRRVKWNDAEVLLRVIDQRLEQAGRLRYKADEIWRRLFPDEVVGLPVKNFLLLHTMARPRDIIYLVKEAVALAIDRGHETVTPDDMLVARDRYSRYVFASVIAEDDPQRNKLEAILYEFAGAGRTLSELDIIKRLGQAGVSDSDDVTFYLNLLCDVNFLAIATRQGFTFASDETEREVLLELAARVAPERDDGQRQFQINPAFYQALQIE